MSGTHFFFHHLFIFSITLGEPVSAALGFCSGKRLEGREGRILSWGEEVCRGSMAETRLCANAIERYPVITGKRNARAISKIPVFSTSTDTFPNRGIHAERHHHLTIRLWLLILHDSVTNVTWDYFTKAAVHCGDDSATVMPFVWFWGCWMNLSHQRLLGFSGRHPNQSSPRGPSQENTMLY